MRLSIRPHRCPGNRSWQAILLAGFVLATGCGGTDPQDLAPSLRDLEVSSRIEPHVEASVRSLTRPDGGEANTLHDLRTYAVLRQAIYDPQSRSTAVDSLLASWAEAPDHLLWPEFAAREGRYFDAESRRRALELFSTPAASDTTTAIGLVVQALRLGTREALTTWFARARTRSGSLAPFPRVWIDLKAAYGARIGGDPERSVRIASDALDSARGVGGRALEAYAWIEITRALLSLGELDDALFAAVLADTLTASTTAPDDPVVDRLQTRELRADVLAARRDADAAFALYDLNMDEASGAGLHYLASRSVNRAAMLAETIGDRALGLRYCHRGLDFALADDDSLNVPRHMMNVARRYRMQGQLDSCLVYQRRAVRWVEAYPAEQNVARMPLLQAEYYAQVGQYDVVDSLLAEAVAHQGAHDTDEARAELHLELIRGWMEVGRPDLVYRSIEAITDLGEGTGDAFADRHVVADLNLSIGEFLTRRGEYASAQRALDMAAEALARRPDPRRSWMLARNRGLLDKARGSWSTAESEFRRCIELGIELRTPDLESTGRLLLGSVFLEHGRPASARAAYPATEASESSGRFTTRVLAHLMTGVAYRQEGVPDSALVELDRARRACRSWSPPDLIARIDLERGLAVAALGQRAEARAIYAGVADRIERASRGISTPELAYFNGDLRRDLVEASILLEGSDASRTLAMARRMLPRWQAMASTSALRANQILFFVGKSVSGRWTTSDAGVHWSALPGARDIAARIAPVFADLSVPSRPVPEREMETLAGLLLERVAQTWDGAVPLVVVTDRSLARLPWPALPLPGTNGTILDRGAVVQSDAPWTDQDFPPVGPRGRLLAMGADVAIGDVSLSRLRHAETEARDVADSWTGESATLRLGPKSGMALEDQQLLDGIDAIHVASHARVYAGEDDRTVLQLAGRNDKPLALSDLRELGLHADLVFLSSCEAGDGSDTVAAPGGIARGFLHAGAARVIAPIVAIDDAAAHAFATRFYVEWSRTGEIAAALRATQLSMRDHSESWAHPFHWAFYQLLGSAHTASGTH